LKEIFGAGSLYTRVYLGNHRKSTILPEGLNQSQRTGTSHRDRQKRARVDDGVAYSQDGKVFEDRVFLGYLGRSIEFGFFDWHRQVLSV